ncbi:hypothetical protein SB751_30295, partial [Cupriavidus sp. SIMBA_020]|uniref:hypothetical protein n=1 Tax=Cupriavidus sp. SIMBA_020 TaxID=3085766 RepID=UPI00397C9C4D
KEDNTFQAMDFNGDGRADFLAKVQLSTYIEEPPCRNRFDCDVNPRSAPLASNQQISQSSLATQNQIEELHNNGDLDAHDVLIPVNSSQLNP